MHEVGIAMELVEMLSERAGGAQVTRVVLEVGVLCAVLPDALRFCFELVTEDTLVAGAKLEIVEKAGRARCRACDAQVVLLRPFGTCACGGTELTWISGEELRIVEMEVA